LEQAVADLRLSLLFQGATPHWQYRGPFEAFGTIARTEGLRGLYRGVGPTMQRAAILNAAQIPSYDHTKYMLLKSGVMHEGIPCHLVSSMTAGLVTAIVMSPIDLIKTRLVDIMALGLISVAFSQVDRINIFLEKILEPDLSVGVT
jgi:hypothetical protein